MHLAYFWMHPPDTDFRRGYLSALIEVYENAGYVWHGMYLLKELTRGDDDGETKY